MTEKEDLFFPYDKIRPEQSEMLRQVDDSIEKKNHLIIHAPTGLGKTIAALGPALKHAIKNKLTIFFLTSRHTQHLIAIETLKEIKKKYDLKFNVVDIIGKKWMCIQPGIDLLYSGEFSEYCKSMRDENKCEFYTNTKDKSNKLTVKAKKILEEIKQTNPHHVEKLVELCRDEKLCPYEMSTSLAHDSTVVVTDYYYLFNPTIRDMFLSKTNKTLSDSIVIVDEGHNLPYRIRDLVTQHLSNFMLKRAIKEAKKHGFKETLAMLSQLQDILVYYSDKMQMGSEKMIRKEDFMSRVNKIADYDQVVSDLEFIGDMIKTKQKKSSVSGISKFLEQWKGGDRGFARIFSFKRGKKEPMLSLSYRCLDPSLISKDVIENTWSTIIMSGTLTPTSMYNDLLGFPKNTIEKEYENPFDEDNRLALVVPETTTKFTMRNDAQFERIAEIIADITNEVPGNSVIFFPSYYLRDQVYRFFSTKGKKTVFLEQQGLTKEEKIEILENFKKYKNSGAVLLGAISGNFAEGIDLPGDLLKCVVVVGLPLQQPDLETKELIKYYDEKFGKGWDYGYIFPAFSKCLQGAGRCIRTETDKGVVVFLDQRYVWPMYARCFPKDYSLKASTHYKEHINHFFEG